MKKALFGLLAILITLGMAACAPAAEELSYSEQMDITALEMVELEALWPGDLFPAGEEITFFGFVFTHAGNSTWYSLDYESDQEASELMDWYLERREWDEVDEDSLNLLSFEEEQPSLSVRIIEGDECRTVQIMEFVDGWVDEAFAFVDRQWPHGMIEMPHSLEERKPYIFQFAYVKDMVVSISFYWDMSVEMVEETLDCFKEALKDEEDFISYETGVRCTVDTVDVQIYASDGETLGITLAKRYDQEQ